MQANGYTTSAGDADVQSAAAAPPAEIDPEVKQLVFDWITETLQQAWSAPEAERKKVIKQLLLKWHPDKNVDDPTLALTATQHIQSEVERLENGLPRSRSAPSSTRTHFTFHHRSPFDHGDVFHQQRYDEVFNSFMEEVRKKREEFRRQCEEREEAARYERELRQRERERQRQRFEQTRIERERREREEERERERREQYERERQREFNRSNLRQRRQETAGFNGEGGAFTNGGPKTNSSSTPSGSSAQLSDVELAEGLLRQAEHDVKAAQNDMGLEEPAFEWACFKAHQAAEKAVKALHLLRIGLKSNSHELSTLAASARDPELLDLAVKIQEIIGNNNKLYNLVLSDFSVIPHDEFTVEKALEAVTCATDILDRVKSMVG